MSSAHPRKTAEQKLLVLKTLLRIATTSNNFRPAFKKQARDVGFLRRPFQV